MRWIVLKSPKFLTVSGGKGYVVEVRPSEAGGLNVYENGVLESDQFYHMVYTGARYVYDQTLSNAPIPKGDWEQHMKEVNPGGLRISRNLKGFGK